ncbi:MAG: hypothetical protein QE290_19155 [Acidovorax sp.]|uniref:hypothetical protein n=1 Tax=Acidovorax sp. TaxID=1872122 RepID=UPI0026318679|nr:hypothetical protein [Acidovorax sp.]MDH4466151.1 hypothetical protein [Acidovorax sp.]
MSAPDLERAGIAVTEAQAVLELVAEKLGADKPLEADTAFTLFAAVAAAISRLDAVHDALQYALDGSDTSLAVAAPEALQ